MELIKSVDLLSGTGVNVDIPPGDYSGLIMRFAGTSEDGQTISNDCGRLRLSLNGYDKCNVEFQQLLYMNDLEGGFPEDETAAGDVFAHTAILPAGYKGMNNIIHVEKGDNLVLSMTYNSTQITDAKIATGTFQVSGLKSKGVQNYWRTIFQEMPNLPSGTDPVIFKAVDNLVVMYFDYTNMTRMLVEIDGRVLANDSVDVLAAISNMLNQKESAYTSLYSIDMTQGQSLSDQLSEEIKVTFTSSAAETPNIILCGMEFDVERTNLSRRNYLTGFSRIIQTKQSRGKSVPSQIRNQPVSPPSGSPTLVQPLA